MQIYRDEKTLHIMMDMLRGIQKRLAQAVFCVWHGGESFEIVGKYRIWWLTRVDLLVWHVF